MQCHRPSRYYGQEDSALQQAVREADFPRNAWQKAFLVPPHLETLATQNLEEKGGVLGVAVHAIRQEHVKLSRVADHA
jgi:hypothetical protein